MAQAKGTKKVSMSKEEEAPVEASEAAVQLADVDPVDDGIEVSVEFDDEEEVLLEDLDPAEELWPSGPTVGQVQEWKEQYGEGNIYVTSLTADKHVLWRTLSRLEYKMHAKDMEQKSQQGMLSPIDLNLYNEEAIAETCILFPQFSREDISRDLAGLPSIIAQEVMEASGFVAMEIRQL